MTDGARRHPPTWFDDLDADGRLERPLATDEWIAYQRGVVVADGVVRLTAVAFAEPPTVVRSRPAMLERFLGLASAQDPEQAVQSYARRWGVLELCEHQLRAGHGSEQVPIAFGAAGPIAYTFAAPFECKGSIGTELVTSWLYFSRQASALLDVIGRLRRGEAIPGDRWRVLCERSPWAPASSPEDVADVALEAWEHRLVSGSLRLEFQRSTASAALDAWLRVAGVAVELRWPSSGGPEIGIRASGLLGALGLQIMLAAADASGWVVCSNCGRLDAPPTGRIRRRSYCQACRADRVPERLASQRYREKRRRDPAFREAERRRTAARRQRSSQRLATGAPN